MMDAWNSGESLKAYQTLLIARQLEGVGNSPSCKEISVGELRGGKFEYFKENMGILEF